MVIFSRTSRYLRLLVACFCATCWFQMAGWAQSFTAQFESPDGVAAGDSAVLQLIFSDCGEVPAPTLPPIENAVTQYAGQSQSISIINGVQSTSIIHRYVVVPKVQGTVVIPALTVTVDNQRLTSRPLTLKVGQGFDSSQIGTLSLEVPKSDLYVGETIPVTVRFQFRHAPTRQEPPSIKMDGFLRGRQSGPEGGSETIAGEPMSVARWTMAITAVKSGDLDLGPAEFPTIYTFQSRRRRSGPFDDPLFNQFFGGGGEQRQINFQSAPARLHVIPPPTKGRPPQYAGAVGRFRMEISATPTNVSVGDPITVKVRIIGRGSFDGLSLPQLSGDSGFQTYPGTNQFEASDVLGLEGVKTFEEVLVPERANLKELSLPPLAYWDPSSRQYGLAEARTLPLTVRANPNSAIPGGPSPAALSGTNPPPVNPNNDLRPLKPDLGQLTAWSPPILTRAWYYGGIALPPVVAAFSLAIGWWQRRPRDRSLEQMTARRASIDSAMTEMERLATEGRATDCFEAGHRALQEQIGLVLGQSGGSFTEEVIDSGLIPRGLEPEAAAQLHELFHAASMVRFAGSASVGDLKRMSGEHRRLITTLRTLEKK